MIRIAILLLVYCLSTCANAAVPKDAIPVGVAQIDITPDYPIRLSGFGNRRTESEGVTLKILAKALAFGDKDKGPAILITADNLAIPDEIVSEVAKRLEKKIGLKRERLTVSVSHTHTAPMLKNVCPTLFGNPIPPEHQAHIDRYTVEFTDALEKVALAAVKDIRPARVSWGSGTVKFSINRRAPGGPVDHDLPVLFVSDLAGKVRAIYVSYACHCVTLSNNKISGDWAGFAQQALQKEYPGAIALTSVGCGADSNPSSGVTGDKMNVCEDQGRQVADEVKRLFAAGLTPITVKPETKFSRVDLPFAPARTRQEWEARANSVDYAVAYHAKVNLARLDRGETLPDKMTYPVQTWVFGDALAIVFMPGETVVDYALRLKREFDHNRLWVNGYANDSQCYLPSERILKEGGYEGGAAQVYYDRPREFAPGLEQKMIEAVTAQLPTSFAVPKGTEGIRALTPAEALRSIKTKPGLEVELVAAEPLVASPVAIDWGADGKLWVCEMFDYPTGLDGNYQPGGRVRFLEDTNHDGLYDKSTVFIDNIPFPTGLTAWGKGVLICAAPDILYAEDTDGDGKADKVEKLYSGFPTENYQARVNSLSIGLDNWIYGANGLLTQTVMTDSGKVDIRNHDFRFRPLKGTFEPVSGLTQQSRVRDDWGRWFGCNNGSMIVYFPHEERYSRRNPSVASPASSVDPDGDFDIGRVFPRSKTLERFNDPGAANRVTSGCGIGIYRDSLLGAEFYGNSFTCEPVHNLVHRLILEESNNQLTIHRGEDEKESEFLASTDNWFRPVQARTGPDGALYVVDMYRFVIEHPRWIPAARLAQLDVRAGAGKGRIYRVVPAGKKLRPIRDLTKLSASQLAAALDSPNGTERDRVHIELLLRRDNASIPSIEKLASKASLPQVRVQALSVLEGLDALRPALVEKTLQDSEVHVRKEAIRLCETFFKSPPATKLTDTLLSLVNDPSPIVVQQLAFTLGEWNDPRAGQALASLAVSHLADADLRAAILSSASHHCGAILDAVMKTTTGSDWVPPLVATAAASGDDRLFTEALNAALPPANSKPTSTHFVALTSLLDELDRKKTTLADYLSSHPASRDFEPRLKETFASAREIVSDSAASEGARENALKLLGRGIVTDKEVELFCSLISGTAPDKIRNAALTALRRQRRSDIATRLLGQWKQSSPATRAQIVSALISRDEWAQALLAAVKDGTVRANEISLADRQQLGKKGSEQTKKLVAEIFPAQPATRRNDVLQKYQAALALSGTKAKGAEIFAKNCTPCHVLDGIGHDVGPNLATLRNKDGDYWMKNILDPNAVVEPRFVSYEIELKDGRSIGGVIKSETANNLTVVAGGGVTETVLRTDVEDIRASSLSLMPEGLEQAITIEGMADLITYLRSGNPPKAFPDQKPELVKSTADTLLLPAAKAEIYGDQIAFEDDFKNIGMWHGENDYVAWTAEVEKAGAYDVHLDYACATDSAGNNFVVKVDGNSVAGTVAATGGDWSNYKQVKIGSVQLQPGRHRISVQPSGPVTGALFDLRTVALSAPNVQPRWPGGRASADGLPRDPASIARFVLDEKQPAAAREAIIAANPQFAAELIKEMTEDLPPGSKEYARIPWIWRVAIACGKRNDAEEIKNVLAVATPKDSEPLRDWQAVVIGGGIINGLSQRDQCPAKRLAEVLSGDNGLVKNLKRSVDLAAAMADNEKIHTGTRYDALRILGLETWEKRGAQLARYLTKDTNKELQMGAVSALADIPSPEAATALRNALPDLAAHNRQLAQDALARKEKSAAIDRGAVTK